MSRSEQESGTTVFILAESAAVTQVMTDLEGHGITARRVDALGSAALSDILLTAMVASTSIPALITTLVRNFRRGVLIDVRDGEVSIRRDKSLPLGTIVVCDKEGNIVYKDAGGDVPSAVDALRPMLEADS
ncbi:hypothetical protein PXH67_42825 (plasmid) [Streptomyces sp. P8-A8]|uniref:hypothetical protein n=1 Tax=Streptomyces sp. P8-A8 TaxID=3029759 RepID=UPI0036DD8C11